MNIALSQAETVIAAARAAAEGRGEKAAYAVVDGGGNLVAFGRADGANLITIDTAVGKAYTAVSLGFDTVHVTEHIQPGQALFGTGLTLNQNRSFVPYGGGLAIRSADGELIGGLGVSGASTSQADHEIGETALKTLAQDDGSVTQHVR